MISILKADVVKLANGIKCVTGHRNRGDGIVRLRVPGSGMSIDCVQRSKIVANGTPDEIEAANGIHVVRGRDHLSDCVVAPWIPSCGQAGGRIQPCEVDANLAADVAERTGHIKLTVGKCDRRNQIVGNGLPCGGRTGQRIQRGDVITWLSANVGKGACRIDDVGARGESADTPVWSRVPSGYPAVDDTDSRQSGSSLAIDRPKVAR